MLEIFTSLPISKGKLFQRSSQLRFRWFPPFKLLAKKTRTHQYIPNNTTLHIGGISVLKPPLTENMRIFSMPQLVNLFSSAHRILYKFGFNLVGVKLQNSSCFSCFRNMTLLTNLQAWSFGFISANFSITFVLILNDPSILGGLSNFANIVLWGYVLSR